MLDIDSAVFERAWSTQGGVQARLQNVHDRGKAYRTKEQRAGGTLQRLASVN